MREAARPRDRDTFPSIVVAVTISTDGFVCHCSAMKNPFYSGYYSSEELRAFGFGEVGANVQIARNCTIVGLANIFIGNNVRIDGDVHLIAAAGFIRLGSHIHIGGGCKLSGRGGIELHDFAGLSQDVKVYSASDDYTGHHMTNPTVPEHYTGVRSALVRLGRHAIVGSGAVILPGACLGEGVAVGALSLVTRPLEPWGVYSGAPAKRLKNRSRALLEQEARMLSQAKDRSAGQLQLIH